MSWSLPFLDEWSGCVDLVLLGVRPTQGLEEEDFLRPSGGSTVP